MTTLLRKVLLIVCSWMLWAVLAWAQDASDRFLQAYQDVQNGEQLERSGNLREALARYKSAENLLEQIVKSDPEWQPPVVAYRLKKTRESIVRIGPDVAQLADISGGNEGTLPQWDPTTLPLPVINTSQPLTSPRSRPSGTPNVSTSVTSSGEAGSLRKQLEKARKDNVHLQEQLARQAGELQSSRFEVDKTKVSLVEIKSQLAQAQNAMENVIHDRELHAAKAPLIESKTLAEVQNKALKVEAGNEVLLEENQRLLAKLERASTYINAADAGRTVIENDRKKIAKQRDDAIIRAQKIKDNTAAMERLAQEKADLQKAFAQEKKELQAKLATASDTQHVEKLTAENKDLALRLLESEKQLAAIPGKILKIEAGNEVLLEENRRLLAKLERASTYINAADAGRTVIENDRKKIAKQRDDAIVRAQKMKDNTAAMEHLAQEKADLQKAFAQEKKELEEKLATASDTQHFEKLTAENKDLALRLLESEKQLAEAVKKPEESAKKLTELRSEIHSLNDRLLESQARVTSRDDQLKGLAKQLDEASGEIARLRLNPKPSADEKRALVENDLLRTIILRQIKEQTEREAASSELAKEITTLQIKSDTIARQIEVLQRPIFQLNDDEKRLFKEPIAMLSEPDPSKLTVTLAMVKPTQDFSVEGPDSLPNVARDLVDQARKLFGSGRFEEAEKLYQQIVESAPNNSFVLSNLGVTQIQAHKLSAAEVALKKATDINPKDTFAATNLGIVYCKQGRFEDALPLLREAVAWDAKDHVAQNYLGICYGEKGQKEQAESAFKQSISIRDDYADAHFNLSVLYATNEPPSLDLSKEHYDKALQYGSEPDASLELLFQKLR